LNEYYVRLWLFKCTLTRGVDKWYIEMKGSKFETFGYLAMVFLNYLQLPIFYDVGIELLDNFEQNKSTHIVITFGNGERLNSLIKVMVPPNLL
jgi:hypothetical protein